MAHLVRQRITCYVDSSGRRVPKNTPGAKKVKGKSAKWYGQGIPGLDPKKRVPLATDKRAAEAMLSDLVKNAERKEANLPVAELEHGRKPLVEHLADFEAHLRAKDNTDKQVRLKVGRIRRTLESCAFVWLGDLDAGKLELYLADLRAAAADQPQLPARQEWFDRAELADLLKIDPRTVPTLVRRHGLEAQGKGKARKFPRATAKALLARAARGMGIQTANYYLREMKSFCRWLCRGKRLAANPLEHMEGGNAEVDIRRGRRSLDAAELGRLLDAARMSTRSFRGMAGTDRWLIYLTACGTGFREGELGSLLPSWFTLSEAAPAIVLPAREGKNRKPITQPLPLDVARELAAYLTGKPQGEPVWPGTWSERGADMLKIDLEAAGIAYAVESPDGPLYADFHSLRHSFVAALDRAGISLKQAMQLARHSDPKLTIKRYGRAQAHELAAAVRDLPLVNGHALRSPLADMPRAELEALAVAGIAALAALEGILLTPTKV
jgi:integrase